MTNSSAVEVADLVKRYPKSPVKCRRVLALVLGSLLGAGLGLVLGTACVHRGADRIAQRVGAIGVRGFDRRAID